jgi:hypothetical protein
MGGQIFIRGIRDWKIDGEEERKLQIQNTWGPIVLGPLWWPLRTIFIEGKPQYNHISSTLVRRIILQPNTSLSSSSSTNPEATNIAAMNNVVGDAANATKTNDGNPTKCQLSNRDDIRTELATLVPECLVDDVIKLYSR